jgi:hypothetical protein
MLRKYLNHRCFEIEHLAVLGQSATPLTMGIYFTFAIMEQLYIVLHSIQSKARRQRLTRLAIIVAFP